METLQPNTIHHGNCFDLLPSIPDASIDAIITDPPYGVLKGHKIETNVDIPRFFAECKRVMKPNAFIAFFGQMPTLLEWCNRAGEQFVFKNEIIWCKRNGFALFGNDINKIHENILIYAKGKPQYAKTKAKWDDIMETDCYDNIASIQAVLRELSYYKALANGRDVSNENYGITKTGDEYYSPDSFRNVLSKRRGHTEIFLKSIWSFLPHNCANRNGKGIPHPTVKPILLLERLIELLTPEPTADFVPLVLDPFAGSGTTAVACQNLNRNFIAMELHEEYVNIGRKRLKESFNLFTDDAFRTE